MMLLNYKNKIFYWTKKEELCDCYNKPYAYIYNLNLSKKRKKEVYSIYLNFRK
jgi:hypothetical protein